ncbi:MAG: hypothetical protein ABI355_16875 [Solirubrobacteraceae bacterium]
MTRRGILTVTIAVLGLALSAALAWSASQLAGQRIGLASEPLSVARGLAPHHTAVRPAAPSHDDRGKRHPRPTSKQMGALKPASTPTSTGSQIFTTPPPTAPSAPASATSTSASPPASGGLSSSGAAAHGDDHADD